MSGSVKNLSGSVEKTRKQPRMSGGSAKKTRKQLLRSVKNSDSISWEMETELFLVLEMNDHHGVGYLGK